MLGTEQLLQRISISHDILGLMQSTVYTKHGIGRILLSAFDARVKACAVNPLAHCRNSLCEMARFYDTFLERSEIYPKAA